MPTSLPEKSIFTGNITQGVFKAALNSLRDFLAEKIGVDGENIFSASGGSLKGPINEAKGTDIASATTTDIGAATGNFVNITGTTTITSLGSSLTAAGAYREVNFAGSLALTHHDNNLILPGKKNIQTQAGDRAGFRYLGSGKWICEWYTLALGFSDALTGTIGLVIKNDGVNPNSKINITADEVSLRDANGFIKAFGGVNLSPSITTSGLLGLDTGVEANSKWYYVWLVSDGVNLSAVFSASSTAPTLSGTASGYTLKKLVGAVWNNGSGNFYTFHQIDKTVYFPNVLAGNYTVISATSFQSANIETIIPPIAKTIGGVLGTNSGAGSAVVLAGNNAGVGFKMVYCTYLGPGAWGLGYATTFDNVPILTPQNLYLTAATTGYNVSVLISSFTI